MYCDGKGTSEYREKYKFYTRMAADFGNRDAKEKKRRKAAKKADPLRTSVLFKYVIVLGRVTDFGFRKVSAVEGISPSGRTGAQAGRTGNLA